VHDSLDAWIEQFAGLSADARASAGTEHLESHSSGRPKIAW
jgi:hypothetical protein